MTDKIRLYGDNGECFGEIDRETLVREWDSLKAYPGIFSPYGVASDRNADDQPRPVVKQPHLKIV